MSQFAMHMFCVHCWFPYSSYLLIFGFLIPLIFWFVGFLIPLNCWFPYSSLFVDCWFLSGYFSLGGWDLDLTIYFMKVTLHRMCLKKLVSQSMLLQTENQFVVSDTKPDSCQRLCKNIHLLLESIKESWEKHVTSEAFYPLYHVKLW